MLSFRSAPDNESGDAPKRENSQPDGPNPAIEQLRRLAMLYHSKGRIKEAREIYAIVLELTEKNRNQSRDE